MFDRLLTLPRQPRKSFFLWGPRQTGKSTLLRARYPDALWVDLLRADEFRRYVTAPERLRERLASFSGPLPLVVIDEVQKVPALLDEVHWLIENTGLRAALCGSSARRVKRGHANLLGGRAHKFALRGLSAREIGTQLDLNRLINHGYLPSVYLGDQPQADLHAYVSDYLKEEIAAEGLVRNLPAFSHFLGAAALSDGEQVNFTTVARDCGVSSPTAKGYFDILVDTLQGTWLPAYRKRAKRRVILAPKFYFADVGVATFLQNRRTLRRGTPEYGKAFENWVHHEIVTFDGYTQRYTELAYWRLPSGQEVDFIVDDMQLVIEAKATTRVRADHLKHVRSLRQEYPHARACVVCLELEPRRTEDGIDILPASTFIERLWEGQLF